MSLAAASKAEASADAAEPVEPEIAGITRRPNEVYADYQARARRLQATLTEGKNSLEKQDYAAALARFRPSIASSRNTRALTR